MSFPLAIASLVVNEVDHNDDGYQDAEADGQRYSCVHQDVHTFVRVYTYTEQTFCRRYLLPHKHTSTYTLL